MEVLAVMRDLAADGMTMLVVTHEMACSAMFLTRSCSWSTALWWNRSRQRDFTAPREERTRAFLRLVEDK